jgi:hypothetical protein
MPGAAVRAGIGVPGSLPGIGLMIVHIRLFRYSDVHNLNRRGIHDRPDRSSLPSVFRRNEKVIPEKKDRRYVPGRVSIRSRRMVLPGMWDRYIGYPDRETARTPKQLTRAARASGFTTWHDDHLPAFTAFPNFSISSRFPYTRGKRLSLRKPSIAGRKIFDH